jgi:hypothetical protein
MPDIDYSQLPEEMREHAEDYVEHGVCGDFLFALFSNQLVETHRRADRENLAALPDWIDWLIGEPPSSCWGSVEKVKAWIAKGGRLGYIHTIVACRCGGQRGGPQGQHVLPAAAGLHCFECGKEISKEQVRRTHS